MRIDRLTPEHHTAVDDFALALTSAAVQLSSATKGAVTVGLVMLLDANGAVVARIDPDFAVVSYR